MTKKFLKFIQKIQILIFDKYEINQKLLDVCWIIYSIGMICLLQWMLGWM